MRDTERKRRRGPVGPKSGEVGDEVDGEGAALGRRDKADAKRRRVRMRGSTNGHRWTEDDSALYEDEDDHDDDLDSDSENDA